MKYERGSFMTVGSRDTLRGLHPTAQCLYMWLSSYANETGNCFPSRKTLANDVGCSESMIDNMLDVLQEKELLKVKGRKEGDRQLSNLYTVLIVPPLPQSGTPPSTQWYTPSHDVRTNSNQLTKPNELEVADAPPFEVVESTDEERPAKRETRKEDKESIFRLFGSKEQPWWRFSQEKKAALSIYDLEGYDRAKSLVQIMRENRDDPYCPQAYTPFEFASKLPKLKAYAKRNS